MTDLAWDPYNRDCPTRQLLDRIGDRWTVLVIGALADGRLRYSEIARRVDGVSQKMLTQTLRALESDGIVSRTIYPEIPPRVEYQLTERGESLQVPLRALEEWAKANMAGVIASRAAAATGTAPDEP